MNQAVEDPKSAIVFSKKSPGVLNMKPSEAKSLPAWDAALGNASAHEQHSLSTSRTRAQRPCKRLEGCPSQICTRTPAKRTIDSARRCENRLDPKPVSVCVCACAFTIVLRVPPRTGVPHALGTPVRHSSSNARIGAPSPKFRKRCYLTVAIRITHGTSVPRRAKIWHSSSTHTKIWHSSSTRNKNVALQFHTKNKSGIPVPHATKMCVPVPHEAEIWHSTSARNKNVALQFHTQQKWATIIFVRKKNP